MTLRGFLRSLHYSEALQPAASPPTVCRSSLTGARLCPSEAALFLSAAYSSLSTPLGGNHRTFGAFPIPCFNPRPALPRPSSSPSCPRLTLPWFSHSAALPTLRPTSCTRTMPRATTMKNSPLVRRLCLVIGQIADDVYSHRSPARLLVAGRFRYG